VLPLINYENRQCGLRACKAVMKEGGVIRSEAVRHPTRPMDPATRAGLMDLARPLDLVAMRWGL
jgi:4-hydroxy-tetrahydrodipicolinate synthase